MERSRGLKALFGVNPLPFRIVVFATVAADVVLLAALVRRLTGSALAAACTPVLWLANPNVAPALCWSSIYNQSQYLFFVLLAFVAVSQRQILAADGSLRAGIRFARNSGDVSGDRARLCAAVRSDDDPAKRASVRNFGSLYGAAFLGSSGGGIRTLRDQNRRTNSANAVRLT